MCGGQFVRMLIPLVAGYLNAAKARRYFEGHPDEALRPLITSNCHS